MPPDTVAARIRQFNQGRQPDVLAQKYAKLHKSPWSFFRGTGHLFYASAALPPELAAAPLAGLCGDLHLENFGVYPGDNGLVCFSANDFDDAVLGPVAWDLARLAASLFVGLAYLRRPRAEADTLAEDFLQTYASAVAAGGPALADVALLDGPIGGIARAFPERGQAATQDESAELSSSGHHLKIDHKRLLPAARSDQSEAEAIVADYARQPQAASALRVLDVARLVAGTSSLGLARYLVLIAGEDPAAVRLLELKEVHPSCAAPYMLIQQPAWSSQALRVTVAQRQFQAVPPALLGAVGTAARSFIVRNYSRARERLSLDDPGLTEPALAATVRTMARVAAGGHLRGSTAEGAAGPAALQAFASQAHWQSALIDFARASAVQSQADYQEYCGAYDRGELAVG